jgi:hypothetical protein
LSFVVVADGCDVAVIVNVVVVERVSRDEGEGIKAW